MSESRHTDHSHLPAAQSNTSAVTPRRGEKPTPARGQDKGKTEWKPRGGALQEST